MSLATFAVALALFQAPQPSTFPDSLLGLWASNIANCGSEDTNGGRIEPTGVRIETNRVEFFDESESLVGRVESIAIDPDGAVQSSLYYTVEGRTWWEPIRFRVSNDLTSVEIDAQGHRRVLVRCAVASGGND